MKTCLFLSIYTVYILLAVLIRISHSVHHLFVRNIHHFYTYKFLESVNIVGLSEAGETTTGEGYEERVRGVGKGRYVDERRAGVVRDKEAKVAKEDEGEGQVGG